MILADRSVNLEGSQEKMRQIWKIISKYDAYLTNYGNLDHGISHEVTFDKFVCGEENQYAHAVFNNQNALKECLRELKRRDFGLSVVVSGLFDEVQKICEDIEIIPHTVEYSLGVHGKKGMLPEDKILEITTMCGHHLVAPNLVKHMVKKIQEGEIRSSEAAVELSRQCRCGIFNPERAQIILEEMVSEK